MRNPSKKIKSMLEVDEERNLKRKKKEIQRTIKLRNPSKKMKSMLEIFEERNLKRKKRDRQKNIKGINLKKTIDILKISRKR